MRALEPERKQSSLKHCGKAVSQRPGGILKGFPHYLEPAEIRYALDWVSDRWMQLGFIGDRLGAFCFMTSLCFSLNGNMIMVPSLDYRIAGHLF